MRGVETPGTAARQGSARWAGELAQPVRHGLLVAAGLSPEGRSRLARAPLVGRGARAETRTLAGGADRRRGVGVAPSLSFGDQGHRGETYKSRRTLSSAQCPSSDFGPFRTVQKCLHTRGIRKMALLLEKSAT